LWASVGYLFYNILLPASPAGLYYIFARGDLMPAIIRGDKTCSKCESKYFSKNATKDMNKHNLCFDCILAYHRYIFADDNDIISLEDWKDGKGMG
jgi:hypothetical protein